MSKLLSKEELSYLQQTLDVFQNNQDRAGKLFYGKLFQTAPETKKFFNKDMDERAGRLVETLALIVGIMEIDSEDMVNWLGDLSRRHKEYGVEIGHYDTYGQVLLETIQDVMQGQPNASPLMAAWTQAYEVIADKMIYAQSHYTPQLPEFELI